MVDDRGAANSWDVIPDELGPPVVIWHSQPLQRMHLTKKDLCSLATPIVLDSCYRSPSATSVFRQPASISRDGFFLIGNCSSRPVAWEAKSCAARHLIINKRGVNLRKRRYDIPQPCPLQELTEWRLRQETITIEGRVFVFRYLISGPVVPPLHTSFFVSVIL